MKTSVLFLCAVMVAGWSAPAQELYRMPSGVRTGETLKFLSLKGPGVIKRIWMTINDRNTDMLRSLKIEMFWDDSRKPAVSAPLGDFFCFGMGKISVFENEFFIPSSRARCISTVTGAATPGQR